MTAPDPKNFFILCSTAFAGAQPTPPEKRAAALRAFLDAANFTAIAVVHGTTLDASPTFDLLKQRHALGRGGVWVTDSELIHLLQGDGQGDDVEVLRAVFKPVDQALVTFFSVKNRKVTGSLKWWQASADEIDKGYLTAGLN